ncbi:Kunitz/Bovine pancreatic trypsin inhibitor domain protein [Ancylostoma ceylanicum]|uniref:Kunitz/Bovine pancreatic trypsin inhibitor domain protein n=2 Tax=Ancylostoma ceylanicum TaxID=53326 RepID=A0A0D6M7D8_9BILA|nr:Kunitz/Bovine pancreatic trypsin inhibitor domain protein [Ancylostoma ceylanicum]EYB98383.1 hypothetical protein Y032_0131g1594 [Ancylostoma ceylanicum]
MNPAFFVLLIAVFMCSVEPIKKINPISHSNSNDQNRCGAPTPERFPSCTENIVRFTYNDETEACEEFTYDGCSHSPNNFETLEECQKECMKRKIEEDNVGNLADSL